VRCSLGALYTEKPNDKAKQEEKPAAAASCRRRQEEKQEKLGKPGDTECRRVNENEWQAA